MLFDSTTSAVETIDIHQLILERDEDVLFLMAGMVEFARASSEVFFDLLQYLTVLPGSMAQAIALDDPVMAHMILPSLICLVQCCPRQLISGSAVKVIPWLLAASGRTDVSFLLEFVLTLSSLARKQSRTSWTSWRFLFRICGIRRSCSSSPSWKRWRTSSLLEAL